MTRFQGEPDEARGALAAPVAIAAISVDGRCRERSPADMALFGPARDQLIERFCEASEGQDLLVRATADGSAETLAELETAAGPMPFRISLWRQRGGDRIRLIAAFAQVAAETAIARAPAPKPDLDRMEVPVQALIALAERVRTQGPESIDRETSDLISAAWRLKAILDDLEGSRSGLAELPLAEIDLARLTRRVTRMAEAALGARKISAVYETDPESVLPNVLGDEHALWDMLDHLVAGLVDGMGEGGRLVFSLASPERGCAVSLTAERALARADLHPRLELARRVAVTHHAKLSLRTEPEGRVVAEVIFPPGRCLAAL
ncbi:MAG: hypothetical protein AAGH74_14205 [Pseudomonadota bacterium]